MKFLGFVILAQDIRIEEKIIEAVRNKPESQSGKKIRVFLGFANFYRRFIKNFSRIATLLISMLQTIDKEALNTQATKNKKNQNASANTGSADSGDINRNIKNLSFVVKLTKFKKPNFAKSNSSGTEFLFFKAKEAFIYL